MSDVLCGAEEISFSMGEVSAGDAGDEEPSSVCKDVSSVLTIAAVTSGAAPAGGCPLSSEENANQKNETPHPISGRATIVAQDMSLLPGAITSDSRGDPSALASASPTDGSTAEPSGCGGGSGASPTLKRGPQGGADLFRRSPTSAESQFCAVRSVIRELDLGLQADAEDRLCDTLTKYFGAAEGAADVSFGTVSGVNFPSSSAPDPTTESGREPPTQSLDVAASKCAARSPFGTPVAGACQQSDTLLGSSADGTSEGKCPGVKSVRHASFDSNVSGATALGAYRNSRDSTPAQRRSIESTVARGTLASLLTVPTAARKPPGP